ncbi:hypothetical protein BC567DRAFT_85765 [Phyllosticta citribraziliensis]
MSFCLFRCWGCLVDGRSIRQQGGQTVMITQCESTSDARTHARFGRVEVATVLSSSLLVTSNLSRIGSSSFHSLYQVSPVRAHSRFTLLYLLFQFSSVQFSRLTGVHSICSRDTTHRLNHRYHASSRSDLTLLLLSRPCWSDLAAFGVSCCVVFCGRRQAHRRMHALLALWVCLFVCFVG